MKSAERIQAFSSLGQYIHDLTDDQFQTIAEGARLENPWFTIENVRMALSGIQAMLDKSKLTSWAESYHSSASKHVALVLAGNIPLVGFHDLLSVLISGHSAQLKLSSKDSFLSRFVLNKIIEIEPRFRDHIHIVERLKDFDAVIATGSDNSSRYFEYYFGKYPHIIRKNRTSVAIVDGFETIDELQHLGTDIFSYFGLGCRNVSKVFAPQGYSFDTFFKSIERFKDIINHHKYNNNYDYQKSILLVNKIPFLDNLFLLLQENSKIVSPISVVYFEHYSDTADLKNKLDSVHDKLQCIVGHHKLANVTFGQAQFPTLTDYADNVNTLEFLATLK